MQQYSIWLLKLVPPIRFGGVLSAVLVFVILYPVFRLGHDPATGSTVPALFFSAIIGYVLWVFSYITEECRQGLQELRPHLALDDSEFERQLARLGKGSARSIVLPTLGGLAAGLVHIVLMEGSWSEIVRSIRLFPLAPIGFLGTLLVWVVMTTSISELIKYTLMFSRLGSRSVQVDLLHTRPLQVFSRVAVVSTLALIGAQALYPLMLFDLSVSYVNILPGLVGTAVPMVLIFVAPIWPVHRRLREAKREALSSLDAQVVECAAGKTSAELDPAALAQLAPLLQYRREINSVPVWPFDAGSITRLILYLVIVPLTWAGAALIELLLESML